MSAVANRDQGLGESEHISVRGDEIPIEPRGLVIETIGVVVAALRASYLIPHQQHRRSDGQHRQRQEVLDLAVTEAFHRWIVAGSLDTAIPAAVVIRTVETV